MYILIQQLDAEGDIYGDSVKFMAYLDSLPGGKLQPVVRIWAVA